jgi:hypothetical protein
VKLSLKSRRLIAIGATLLAVAIGVPRVLTHTPYQRLGVRLEFTGPMGFARVADVVGPPGKGVLLKGDLLVEFEGKALTQQYVIERFRRGAGGWPSEDIQLVVERNGQRRMVTIPPLRLSAWQRVRAVTLPLVGLIASPLVAFLLVWRRPDLKTAWLFLWLAILTALGTVWNLFRYTQVELAPPLKTFFSFYHALIFFYPASFLHFMSVFPRPRWTAERPTRSVWFWLVVAAYATPLALIAASLLLQRPVEPFYMWFERIAVTVGCLALIERYARPARPGWQPMTRERVIALIVAVTQLAATALDAFANDAQMVALFSVPLFRLAYTVLVFGLLGTPLLIAYLIANDPAFDPRRLIVRSLPYAVLTGVLAALYLGVVLVGERLFAAATGEETMTFNVVAALVVAYAFFPFRERLQRWIDALYGRDPRALRLALDQAGRELLGALDDREVRGSVEAAIARGVRRPVRIEWPETGFPRIGEGEEMREEERSAIESLLVQAGIRLENLSLQKERADAERRAVELREAAARAELRALHAQVQPHFLFNALNALSYLTETDPPAAQRFTERLADMLRYTVAAGERPAALLSEEIGFVEDYLAVARERYENPLRFEYRGSPELLSVAVPPLLLQPLVENSLKHGCRPGSDALNLTLEACAMNGWLTLKFRDDGAPTKNGGPGLGVGLQNLDQRVRRFGGADAGMRAGAQPDGGFEVELRWRVSAPATT